MQFNPYATIIACIDGLAICEDEFVDLRAAELPESSAEPGSVIDISILQELSSFPQNTQQEILEYVGSQAA